MPGILVGVDGSNHSGRALAWAIREAAHHHVPLTVMTVHPPQVRPATQVFWNIPELPEDTRGEEDLARTAVSQFVEKVASEIGEKVPDVTVNAVVGDPAEELIKASRDADLVVVGSRGGGGFSTLLMGSVSSKLVHHAACPVVVVRKNR
jgi:nucleotide-binding universal stress UspA family protein